MARSSARGSLPAVPLGSLTQPGADTAQCSACGSSRVTRIAISLTDGTPVEFTSCHTCEHRTWTEAGELLEVHSVLDKARKRT